MHRTLLVVCKLRLVHNYAKPQGCINKFSSILHISPEMSTSVLDQNLETDYLHQDHLAQVGFYTELSHLQNLVSHICTILRHPIDVYGGMSESQKLWQRVELSGGTLRKRSGVSWRWTLEALTQFTFPCKTQKFTSWDYF